MNIEIAELFSAIENEYQAETFMKLIGLSGKPRPEKPSKKTPRSGGSIWSEEDTEKLIRCREQGLGPTAMYLNGTFPGRTKSAIRNKLKEVYEIRPELRDAEMQRRARVQYEDREIIEDEGKEVTDVYEDAQGWVANH